MASINNIRGRGIRWDQADQEWSPQDRIFLERLPHARRVVYITRDHVSHTWDAIELVESAKYWSMRMSVAFLARLLGFSPPVPEFPGIEEMNEEWRKMDSQTRPLLQQYHQYRLNQVLVERAKARRAINEEEWKEFMEWLKRHYKVHFLQEAKLG